MRKGAAPEPLRATLFGKGAFQTLDGEAHRLRKQMFMSLMTDDRVTVLVDSYREELRAVGKRWSQRERIVLFDEMLLLLAKTVCWWAGVPLKSIEIRKRTRDLTAMFDRAASGLAGHIRSRLGRARTENWIAGLVKRHRGRRPVFLPGTPADIFSKLMTDENGRPLHSRQVAREIINILRPTIAVSIYNVFVAHALALNPRCKEKILSDPIYLFHFVEEIRRLYPFFPSVVARAAKDFDFKGYHIPRGARLILDLFGTNRDPLVWRDPHAFQPERFLEEPVTASNLIPQGAGDHFRGHRCPGEKLTIALVSATADHLLKDLEYDLPEQNLAIDMSRVPALLRSGFIMSNVHLLSRPPSRAYSIL